MSTSTIESGTPLATLVNVFTVEPDRQQELVDLLVRATEDVMQHIPGFVSANIHASADGERVVNYAQWESEDAFRAMLTDPTAQEHMQAIGDLASADPRLYTVASVHHA